MLPNFPPGASSAPRERQERGHYATVGGRGDKGDSFVGVGGAVRLATPLSLLPLREKVPEGSLFRGAKKLG